jgi:dihydrolipoamide dehydrogenase
MRVIVLGGGPGGYTAAFEAARLGAEVTLIERDDLGGTCLNWGCIPTKTILRSAHIVHDTRYAAEFGLHAEPAAVDLPKLRERKEGVVSELRGQIESQARRLKVDVVCGTGRLVGPRTVEVDLADGGTAVHEADILILATGSVVFKLPCIDHDLPGVWTSDEAVSLTEIPAELVLVGGGIIGLEFANAYAAFGTKVTVVELMAQVMPGNDKRVAKAVQASLEAMGVEFRLQTSVTHVEQVGDRVRATLSDGEMLEGDIVMSAVGRKPNSEGFGFPEAGIEMDRAAVKVDEFFRTNVPGVYAIGDLIGGMMLAHVADEEGLCAVRNAFTEYKADMGDVPADTRLHSVDYDTIPACVYTFLNVGVVGRTRDDAKERGLDAVVAVAKFAGNGKALGEGESEGFVQLVAEKGTGRILGCQIAGPHAVETIHVVSEAMTFGINVRRLADMVYAHPTVTEVIKMAAGDAAGKAGVQPDRARPTGAARSGCGGSS